MLHLTDLSLKNFTCFSDMEISFSSGINVFIGANGTGKTHILKVLYSACAITTKGNEDVFFAEKLLNAFSTILGKIDWFRRKPMIETPSNIKIQNSQNIVFSYEIPDFDARPDENTTYKYQSVAINSKKYSRLIETEGRGKNHLWKQEAIPSVYIPVKEFLSHAPGFSSLVKTRRIAFDETYPDLLTQAFLPHLIKPPFQELRDELLKALKSDDVILRGENFYLKSGDNEFEFSFIAEGLRKIALLFWLIQTGSIAPGSVLFWDEPEANMNPVLLNLIVKSLLTFQRAGIQIFLTTHNYVLLKEFDLQALEEDKIRYFSLYFDEVKDGVQASISDTYLGIENSEIARTYDDLFNREMERKFK